MPSPVITFRLTPHQLARGLQIIRSQEPNFKLTSLNQLVKRIYLDYLVKMPSNQPDQVDSETLATVQTFILTPQKKEINLASLVDAEEK